MSIANTPVSLMNHSTTNLFLQTAMITGLLLIIYFLCMPVVVGLFNNIIKAKESLPTQSVLELSESRNSAQRMVINRAKSMLTANPKATIEVVAWGDGINLLTRYSAHKQSIQYLTNQGVIFTACQNSLQRVSKEPSTIILLPGVRTVADGRHYADQLKNNGYNDELA